VGKSGNGHRYGFEGLGVRCGFSFDVGKSGTEEWGYSRSNMLVEGEIGEIGEIGERMRCVKPWRTARLSEGGFVNVGDDSTELAFVSESAL